MHRVKREFCIEKSCLCINPSVSCRTDPTPWGILWFSRNQPLGKGCGHQLLYRTYFWYELNLGILLKSALQWKGCHKHGKKVGLPFSAGNCALSMCDRFGVWSWQTLDYGRVCWLCCANFLSSFEEFQTVYFWLHYSIVPAKFFFTMYITFFRF